MINSNSMVNESDIYRVDRVNETRKRGNVKILAKVEKMKNV